jgi:hypothetical protein
MNVSAHSLPWNVAGGAFQSQPGPGVLANAKFEVQINF